MGFTMFAYFVTDKEGWNISDQQFENNLENTFADYRIGDSREAGRTLMKVYGITENEKFLGRIDVSYRPSETLVIFTGDNAEGLVKKLVPDSHFEWTKQ